MKFLRKLPVRSKLMIIMMITSTVALVIACAAFAVTDYLSMRKQAGDDLTTLAKIVAANSGAAIVFGDTKSAQETLSFIHNQSHILSAVIYDESQRPLARYARNRQPGRAPAIPLINRELNFEKNTVSLFKDVHVGADIVGVIYLQADMQKLDDRIALYARIVILVLLSTVTIAFLLSARLQRIITDPLVYLASLVRQISTDKNYSLRAIGEGEDEIGNLITGFNEMLSEIQSRDDELEQHRERLEERVKQRTVELESANRELEVAKKEAESSAKIMTHQAHHDALTGLPNRILLSDRINQSLAHATRSDSKIALLFLDLDHFKVINDSLGHSIGDHMLCVISERLQRCVRAEDTVARLGGDEFTVLLTDIQESRDARRIAQKIIDALKQPITIENHELHITTSIGISIFPDDGTDSVTLIKNADVSMYRAKELGRNKVMYYTPDMNVDSLRRLSLANALRKALANNELELHFQPKVETRTLRVLGAEALLRWTSPEFGKVSPNEFIPVAEEMGLISELGEWVLKQACIQHRIWENAGYGDLTIAVNISARQLSHGGIDEVIRNILNETGLNPGNLELEITESIIMQDATDPIIALNELKKSGIMIAMDDFGSGYSSLSYLRRLPVDIVKMDQDFVHDIPGNKEDAAIAVAIISMAHSLGLTVVAEGVESNAQLLFFRQHSCDAVQGNYISEALTSEDFLKFLGNNKHPCSITL